MSMRNAPYLFKSSLSLPVLAYLYMFQYQDKQESKSLYAYYTESVCISWVVKNLVMVQRNSAPEHIGVRALT